MDKSEEILFQSSLREAFVNKLSWARTSTLTLSINISSADHGVAHPPRCPEGFREAVVVHDMREPCVFPSLDSRQKRFLWAHKEAGLAPRLNERYTYG